MQKFSKILTGLGILVLVIGAGILVGWWGSRDKSAPQIHAPVAAPDAMTPVSQNPAPHAASNRPPPVPVPAPATPSVAANPAVESPGATNLITNWEDKLDDVLGSEEDDTNKVKELFAMFPRLPADGQVQVAEHLANLVPDDNYAPLGQLLQNPKLPEEALDDLMGDLLNRPNSVKLPQLLQVAQNPQHPKADEAKDLIELYLDEEDPAKWQQKMQDWLKDNPD